MVIVIDNGSKFSVQPLVWLHCLPDVAYTAVELYGVVHSVRRNIDAL